METRDQAEPEQQKFNHDTRRGWSNEGYKGLVHKVTFPQPYLAINEIMGWVGLGYYAIGRRADARSGRTITVYNYIDPAFKTALEASGIVFETEEHGELTPGKLSL